MQLALGLLALISVLTSDARAGACCVGSTTTVPTRLGECEHGLVSVGLAGEASYARWDRSRALTASSLDEQAVIGTISGAVRWNRKSQASIILPMRANHVATPTLDGTGGGVGDLRLAFGWDPLTEHPRGGENRALPVPVFTFGARLPTGRGWDDSNDPLGADVTGLSEPAVQLGVTLERTVDTIPWSLTVDTDLGVGADGTLLPVFTFAGGVGKYVTTRWSVLGSVVHTESITPTGGSSRTALGAKITHGTPMRGRFWAGVDSDLPVPGLGRSAPVNARVGTGVIIVR